MSTEYPDTVTPAWRGFHHVALATPDLDATIRFYGDILGMRAGDIFPVTERKGVIASSNAETWGLHFFEQPGARIFAYPETFERSAVAPDENAALALRQRLDSFDVAVTPTSNIGAISNMLFRDNTGTLLPATWPK